ncbi:MAG: 3'(2'),5'-bisphosphate nucleotidase CysQ [Elusimicrobia bacterium]|nr:3'(2'),5'-bisphosphate nucleotidase CysQ [Elusimicrobiota bacterium]
MVLTTNDKENLKNGLRQALDAAGAQILRFYQQSADVRYKEDSSPLTQADIASNRVLQQTLTILWPKAAWLSEETVDDARRLGSRWVWIVDPLDGTKEFVRGIAEFAISAALVEDGEVILGGVFNPATKEWGVAMSGEEPDFGGFHSQVSRGEPSSVLRLNQADVSVSRSELERGTIKPYLPFFTRFTGIGSVSYKLLRVAAGLESLTVSAEPKSEWDVAGGSFLVKSAGMAYQRFDRREVFFNQQPPRFHTGTLAGTSELVDEFLKIHDQLTKEAPCGYP